MLLAARCPTFLLPCLPSVLTEKFTKTVVRTTVPMAEAKQRRCASLSDVRFTSSPLTPADTKGFPNGKFEGSGEAGVIAGYT